MLMFAAVVFSGAGFDERAGAQGEEDEQCPGHRRQAAEGRTPRQEDRRGETVQDLKMLNQSVCARL